VDINTIRAWLGHVSLNTTNIYAKVDLENEGQGTRDLRKSSENLGSIRMIGNSVKPALLPISGAHDLPYIAVEEAR
jgi:hypothetical protein